MDGHRREKPTHEHAKARLLPSGVAVHAAARHGWLWALFWRLLGRSPLPERAGPSVVLSGDGASSSGSDKKKEKAATPLPTATLSEHTTQALKRHSLNFDDGLTFDLLLQIATIACSGAISGLFTYAWRTPWDTLYKKSVGWRDPDAPLWSMSRFLRSPRGLKALGVGAATWSAYEVADAGIRYLAALSEDDVAPGRRDPGRTASETSPFR